MHEEIRRGFDRVEEQKAVLLARVAARGEADQVRTREGGGWSPRALLHHMILAEEQTVLQIAAASTAPDARSEGGASLVRRALVALLAGAMRAGVPLPAPPQMTPPDAPADLLTPSEAAARWDEARRVLRARLEAVTPETAGAPVALHPILGPLDARQALDLLDAHLVYHLRQAARWGTEPKARSRRPAG